MTKGMTKAMTMTNTMSSVYYTLYNIYNGHLSNVRVNLHVKLLKMSSVQIKPNKYMVVQVYLNVSSISDNDIRSGHACLYNHPHFLLLKNKYIQRNVSFLSET